MKRLASRCLFIVLSIGGWEYCIRPVLAPAGLQAQDPASSERDNEELARLYKEDQGDRTPKAGKEIDWNIVGPRDKQREARVKEIYEKGELRTGMDYYHVAMVLQHAPAPEDYLLAHELCIVAVAKGVKRQALWLAAASEDRFLMNVKRPQRFGTQYQMGQDKLFHLHEVGPGITDGLRKEFHTPTLADAKKREEMFNKKP